ncbi:MAG: type III-D CRISPR-associated protein Csx19 [Bryobacteraceae bacterium]
MSDATRSLAGASFQALDRDACERLLKWLRGEGSAPERTPEDLRWALAHSDDGVTWGRYERDRSRWLLSSQAAPRLSPSVRRDWLQQLRLFGPSAEVLMWRDGDALRGRVMRDDGRAIVEALRPSEESRILVGEYVVGELPDGFTHVGDRAGLQQVLPLAVTKEDLQRRQARLKVRHYWQEDPETGAVRIAATRLVDVFIEGKS